MAIHNLNLSSTYCPTWKTWEGVRELVQNAVDGQEAGYPMSIEYFPRTDKLVLTNQGAQLPEEALVLGYSFKGSASARGKHGEGLKVGLLALARAGNPVTIYNGKESWRPEMVQRGSLSVLSVRTRSLTVHRPDLVIEIENIPETWWAIARKLFLFVAPPPSADVIQVDDEQILLHPDYAGHVFCKGIFVTKIKQLQFGYEIPSLELDRDRGMVESWDFRFRMSQLWERACQAHPARAVPKLYEAMASGTAEELRVAEGYSTHMRASGRALKAEMRRRNGDGAVAVARANSAIDLTKVGLAPVLLPAGLVTLMDLDGDTAETVHAAQRERVSAVVDTTTLSEDETAMLERLKALVPPDKLTVVHFADPEIRARNEERDRVLVDRSLLALPIRSAAALVVAAEAARAGRSPADIYLEALFP